MRAFAVALAALAALAGCGGSSSGTPRTLPPVTSSPSPVSAASPTPTGKDAPTPEGAAAFARFFYAALEKAFSSGDPAELQRYSTSNCQTCRNFIDSISAIRAAGGRVGGYRITVTTAVAPATSGPTARVDVLRSSTESVEYDRHGKVVQRQPGHTGIEEQMNLVRLGGSWRVDKLILIRVRG